MTPLQFILWIFILWAAILLACFLALVSYSAVRLGIEMWRYRRRK